MTNSPTCTRRVPARHRLVHSLLSLVIAVPVLVSYWTPAVADEAILYGPGAHKKVAARMELEINNIHIYDDREPFYELGGAEIRLEARIWKMKQGDGCPRWINARECNIELTKTVVMLSGSTDETVEVSRTLPEHESGGRDRNSDRIGPGVGIPMYEDEVYGWEIYAVDEDVLIDDRLGWLVGEISQSNNWGTPGEYDERGWVACDDENNDGFCSPPFAHDGYNIPDQKPAHFSVQYKLRFTPLPDLSASGFRYDTQRGAICMRVTNLGSRPAGPFEILFRADATLSAAATQQSYSFLNGLGVNESQEPCLNPLLPVGERAVSFIIDEDDRVLEGNESNNRYDSRFTFLAFPSNGAQSVALPPNPGPAPTPTPTPGTPTADLIVTGIQVKGEQSGGKSGCDPGQNDVTVSIKNQGTGPAASFVVRLTAKPDGDAEDIAREKTVAALNPGAEQDLLFENLRLKKGQYDLEATVDAKNTVTESNQNNNKEKVSVNCQD